MSTETVETTPTIDDVYNHLHEALDAADLVSTDTGEEVASLSIKDDDLSVDADNLVIARSPKACQGRPLAYFRVSVEEIPLVEGPQVLDLHGKPARGEANLGRGAEISRDGRAGLILDQAHRWRLERGDADLAEIAPILSSLPGDRQDEVVLAVAWGVPAGTGVVELDDAYERSWVPAAGSVAAQTWYPQIES